MIASSIHSSLSVFLLVVTFFCVKSNSSEIASSLSLSNDECLQLGFNRENLLCSSCDLLEKYNLEGIKDNCSRCCNEIQTDNESVPVKKYPKARLEVCWCKFPTMPQIEAFVKSDRPNKFPNLTVKHIDGQSPIIKLISENGMVEQTLSITKWDTDTIEEFLQTYLV